MDHLCYLYLVFVMLSGLFLLSCLSCFRVCFCYLVIACLERADLLALVCDV